jgi:hypothetical protein
MSQLTPIPGLPHVMMVGFQTPTVGDFALLSSGIVRIMQKEPMPCLVVTTETGYVFELDPNSDTCQAVQAFDEPLQIDGKFSARTPEEERWIVAAIKQYGGTVVYR